MTCSTANDLLNTACKTRIAPIPGLEPWGFTFYMRSLTERQARELQLATLDKNLKVDRVALARNSAKLVQMSLCDENGKLIFTESQVPLLQDMDHKLLNLLHSAIEDHCGVGAKEKNSETTLAGESSSSLPGTSDDGTSTSS